uniref:otoancorin isoform X2 n=1 Tax=Doryrhamphus excisus TaxID=161450 RepID=UPI0025AEA1E1|nr:otoancorin isoform X2 [Doryrhamphus excisus]
MLALDFPGGGSTLKFFSLTFLIPSMKTFTSKKKKKKTEILLRHHKPSHLTSHKRTHSQAAKSPPLSTAREDTHLRFIMAARGGFSLLIVSCSALVLIKSCNAQPEWMNSDTMHPHKGKAALDSFDSYPPETMCATFRSANFTSKLKKSNMAPSSARKLLQKMKACYAGTQEFVEDVQQLGSLACYFNDTSALTPELNQQVLALFAQCYNPLATVQKTLVLKNVFSNTNWTTSDVLRVLGVTVSLLSPIPLDNISSTDLQEALTNLTSSDVQLTTRQQRSVVTKVLGDEKCPEVSSQQLLQLAPVVKGVPRHVLQSTKAWESLADVEVLRNISMGMSRGQRKAVLLELLKKRSASELVRQLPGSLLRSMSVENLDEADITSFQEVRGERLSRPQAAFLAKKLFKGNESLFWRTSLLQGVTCQMIDKVADTTLQDMAQAVEKTPWWLSQAQVGCAARKYLATLRKEHPDYFQVITEEQLNSIPTSLFIHLPPRELNHLPDSVCQAFLDKMQTADLSSLPRRSPSRPALLQKALLCLTKENTSSLLTMDDVSRLGPLICELEASTLSSLVDADSLNSSLHAMAACPQLPLWNSEALMELVTDNFGDPSDWSQETMESLGPLLVLNETTLLALPFKPWITEVFYFLRTRHQAEALRRKFFNIITSKREQGRRRRTANAGTRRWSGNKPTVAAIAALGKDNVFWSADQLDAMPSDTFLVAMETLGTIPDYDSEQLRVLSKKATEVLGPASQMNESVVAQMGCIAQGFSNSDLERMAFSLDTLEEIGRCGWKTTQLNPVWRSVAKRNNLAARRLDASHMVALNRFMCGLSADEISRLDLRAFRDAVGGINDIRCSLKVAQRFKKPLVSAFGDPGSWTAATVSEVGNMIGRKSRPPLSCDVYILRNGSGCPSAGLHARDLKSMDASVFMFLRESCVPLLHPTTIAGLSADQLSALGPDNAAKVTRGQRAALSRVQLDALERAEMGEGPNPASQVQSSGNVMTVQYLPA